jgi:hypothetical protein
MNFFFGYMWFRISKVYRKEDKIGITGSGFLALSQILLFMQAALWVLRPSIGQEYLSLNSKHLGYFGVGLILAMMLINHKLYSNRYDEFYEQWKKESRPVSIIKGLLIIAFLLSPFAIGMLTIKSA